MQKLIKEIILNHFDFDGDYEETYGDFVKDLVSMFEHYKPGNIRKKKKIDWEMVNKNIISDQKARKEYEENKI